MNVGVIKRLEGSLNNLISEQSLHTQRREPEPYT